MLLLRKRRPYRSQSPSQPPGAGGEPLLRYLVRDAEGNAPYYCAGNLLIHSVCTEDSDRHMIDYHARSFTQVAAVPPGLHHTCLFPTTSSVRANDRLTDEAAALKFCVRGQDLEPRWRRELRTWAPWLVEDGYEGPGFTLRQSIAVLSFAYADVLGCRIEVEGDPAGVEAVLTGQVFRTVELTAKGDHVGGQIVAESPEFRFTAGGPWMGIRPSPSRAVGTCFAIFTNLGLPSGPADNATYRCSGRMPRTLWILFAAGFEADEVESALAEARSDLDRFFDRTRERWQDHFRRDVPAFACSDRAVERVYAELMATSPLCTFDVPYDPFRYPFRAVAGKNKANWHQQFWHDTLFHTRADLWVNDAQRCTQDLRQMLEVQYLYSNIALGEPYPDPVALIPTQINMLAMVAWDVFCRNQDTGFLRLVLDRLLEWDRRKCRPLPPGTMPSPDANVEEPPGSWMYPYRHHDPDGDWLVNSRVAGDDSCRADPFDSPDKLQEWYKDADTPIETADSNHYLLANRLALRRMAQVLDDRAAMAELDSVIATQRSAMERLMWIEEEGRYADLAETSHQRSPVRDVGNITVALAGGNVDQSRAERMMADLFDPRVFWTPMPCPSCPLDFAGIKGRTGFRPTGYWRGRVWGLYIIEALLGLDRYERKEHASYLTHVFLRALTGTSIPSPENFNPLDGKPPKCPAWMSFTSQFLHPFLTFTTGLRMRPDNDLEFDPIALDPTWSHFQFGPFQYRPDVTVTVVWDPKEGYRVRVNGQEWRFPAPTRFCLLRQNGAFLLDQTSVRPVPPPPRPPVEMAVDITPEGAARFHLHNLSGAAVQVRLSGRLLVYDQGLVELTHDELSLAARTAAERIAPLPAVPGGDDLDGRAWILAALEIEGFPVAVCQARAVGQI